MRGVNKVIVVGEDQKLAEIAMYVDGKSLPEIADHFDCSRSGVRYRIKAAGVLRGRADSVRNAFTNNRIPSKKGVKRKPFSDEWKNNIKAGRRKWGKENAVGLSTKSSGYVEHTRGDNKGRGDHRVIMEKRLGRKLQKHEHVHHKNEIKSDNRADNLEVMTISEHMSHHAKQANRNRNNKGQFA